MNEMEIWTVVISSISTVLGVILTILSFARTKNNDGKQLEARLTAIEKDILYIRESLDESKQWHDSIETRLRALERVHHEQCEHEHRN